MIGKRKRKNPKGSYIWLCTWAKHALWVKGTGMGRGEQGLGAKKNNIGKRAGGEGVLGELILMGEE